MEDIKCPLVAINKVRNTPFTPIERAFSVPSYDVLYSKTITFEVAMPVLKQMSDLYLYINIIYEYILLTVKALYLTQ